MKIKAYNSIHIYSCHLLHPSFQCWSFPPLWAWSSTVPAQAFGGSATRCPSPFPVPGVSSPDHERMKHTNRTGFIHKLFFFIYTQNKIWVLLIFKNSFVYLLSLFRDSTRIKFCTWAVAHSTEQKSKTSWDFWHKSWKQESKESNMLNLREHFSDQRYNEGFWVCCKMK